MARNEVGLEAALFDDLAECDAQRPKTFTKWPARTGGSFAVLHSLPLAFRTHWNGSRDSWCIRQVNGCERCARGQGFKGHYVWAIWDLTRRQHGALDLNDKAARQLLEADIHVENRLGCCYSLKKEGGVENGRILITHTGMTIRSEDYGDGCDVVALVCKTYGITLEYFDPEMLEAISFGRRSPAPRVGARVLSAQG